MASEYYRKKFQDIKPTPKTEYTKAELLANWWHYHWLHVLIAVAAAAFVIYAIVTVVTRPRWDCKIAFVGASIMSADTQVLVEELQTVVPDCNGDGKVQIQMRSFCVDQGSSTAEPDVVALFADVDAGNSDLFILENPDWFHARYGVTSEAYSVPCESIPILADYPGCVLAVRTDVAQSLTEENPNAMLIWEALAK